MTDPIDPMTRIGVIGSGMAGLACAARLREAGFPNVTILDKGRRPGGRLAARRVKLADGTSLRFDHGGQFATVRDPGFQALMEMTGARPWIGDRWIGIPAMRSIAEALSNDLTVLQETEVTRAERGDSGWTLWRKESDGETVIGSFDVVIATVPAPQAAVLFPQAAMQLSQVRYDPCWAVMLAFEERWEGVSDIHEKRDTDLAWITRENAKPGREQGLERLVVHMSGDWSRAHLELSPTKEIVPRVMRMLEDRFGPPPGAALLCSAHRWRYAKVEIPLGAPCLALGNGLVLAGDWCQGGRVEAAYLSGVAASETLLRAGE